MSSMGPGYSSYQRGPGAATVIFISILTSVLASATTVVAFERFNLMEVLAGARGETVEVPQLRTMQRESADEVLKSRGLRLVVAGQKHANADKGVVIEQNPLAGSRVRRQDAITVTLSAGVLQVAIPKLAGKTQAAATTELEELGLKLGEVKPGEPGEPGVVTATEPEAGEQVEPGAAVSLTIAVEGKITVPDLKDMHIREAKEKLAQLELVVGDVKERYNRRKRGYLVLRQAPEAGTEVDKETPVDLVINQGD